MTALVGEASAALRRAGRRGAGVHPAEAGVNGLAG